MSEAEQRLTTRRLSPVVRPPWDLLPDDVLLIIFSYLPFKDLSTAACTCCAWLRVAYDELLWKEIFYKHYSIDRNIGIAEGRSSWRQEFKRLHYHSPSILIQTIKSHTDQVLHISFSNDGKMFATSSKDGFIKVWNADHPVTLRHSRDMCQFSWQYTQFSKFNANDSLLLVSGVYFGGGTGSTAGEIAIFSLNDENSFELQCRVKNKPYDVFGTWYNENYLISGNISWLGVQHEDIITCSTLSLNYAFQATESEENSVVSRILKFKNYHSSTVRTLLVADLSKCKIDEQTGVRSSQKLLIFTKGIESYLAHVIAIKYLPEYAWAESSGMRRPPDADSDDHVNLLDSDYDQVDFSVDVRGHTIGMELSPDNRYLFANVRSWPPNADITDSQCPPPIAQEIDIVVIDLLTMTRRQRIYRSHRAFTPDDNCFFIFLDVSQHYLASGAEDKFGHLWERHYHCPLQKFSHNDVVNSVAFNPLDEETITTVSDDFSIKIWTSKHRKQSLKIANLVPSEDDMDYELDAMECGLISSDSFDM